MKGMYISAVIFYHDEVSISVTVMIGISCDFKIKDKYTDNLAF